MPSASRPHRPGRLVPLLLIGAACASTPAAAGKGEVPPDFGGRPVVDLSDNQAPEPGKGWKPLAAKLDPALHATTHCGGDEPLGQLPWIGEDDPNDARQHERARIGGTEGMVSRQGAKLVVAPARGVGVPLAFTDWNLAVTKNAEGDTRYYYYAGTMAGSGYLRVEVHYGHDAPGSYLIQAGTGALAYVHNGDKVAAVSGDGLRVATFDELNEPYRVVLAALEPTGPRIELECRFARPAREVRAHTCGWLDATHFELSWGRDGEAPVPYRFAFQDKHWQLAAGAAQLPVEVHCWAQPKH